MRVCRASVCINFTLILILAKNVVYINDLVVISSVNSKNRKSCKELIDKDIEI